MKTWHEYWQDDLKHILKIYEDYRLETRCFYCNLLIFFFCVNAICYWVAINLSFPELIDQQFDRIAKIQQPVAFLGGLFDSLSFYITVWLIRKASKTQTGKKLVGILSVDLFIAAIATAWVLIAVVFSSWLIGPPKDQENEIEKSIVEIVARENSLPESPGNVEINGKNIAEQESLSVQSPDNPVNDIQEIQEILTIDENRTEDTAPVLIISADSQSVQTFDAGFYQEMLVKALQNPFDNVNYFLFGIIMGISTLFPTIFHLFVGFSTYLKFKRE